MDDVIFLLNQCTEEQIKYLNQDQQEWVFGLLPAYVPGKGLDQPNYDNLVEIVKYFTFSKILELNEKLEAVQAPIVIGEGPKNTTRPPRN